MTGREYLQRLEEAQRAHRVVLATKKRARVLVALCDPCRLFGRTALAELGPSPHRCPRHARRR